MVRHETAETREVAVHEVRAAREVAACEATAHEATVLAAAELEAAVCEVREAHAVRDSYSQVGAASSTATLRPAFTSAGCEAVYSSRREDVAKKEEQNGDAAKKEGRTG
jgi:DNA-binding GntR family transcriptional regulator